MPWHASTSYNSFATLDSWFTEDMPLQLPHYPHHSEIMDVCPREVMSAIRFIRMF
jgi:hypothetical protein